MTAPSPIRAQFAQTTARKSILNKYSHRFSITQMRLLTDGNPGLRSGLASSPPQYR